MQLISKKCESTTGADNLRENKVVHQLFWQMLYAIVVIGMIDIISVAQAKLRLNSRMQLF